MGSRIFFQTFPTMDDETILRPPNSRRDRRAFANGYRIDPPWTEIYLSGAMMCCFNCWCCICYLCKPYRLSEEADTAIAGGNLQVSNAKSIEAKAALKRAWTITIALWCVFAVLLIVVFLYTRTGLIQGR